MVVICGNPLLNSDENWFLFQSLKQTYVSITLRWLANRSSGEPDNQLDSELQVS